ncbi:MAG: nitrate/nitrite transporter NrtS [Deltaproteobacteria bacterium]|nr:nitrate/nitrite transporter NrtS [Deltaproteobacteria bacterium]MBW1919066.1 nitrate/nitrite transporter NrtS [Deltaproteobacteria bacterium]MBW1936774.1 nitrate/nitrite transporter NrtS [Deltaproteobacteria bacterium]MBW1978590.1 nitrate/nitrite transporter NrtS [Deltaproteobacteria bacterium]MBW2045759.1 nitrate/nitrite transporter NrtS [Deltaproteobacteria bacterium]
MDNSPELSWWQATTSRPAVKRALAFAVVVGPILIIINHGDSLIKGHVSLVSLTKMAMTVAVPYCVSTFSSVGTLRQGKERSSASRKISSGKDQE